MSTDVLILIGDAHMQPLTGEHVSAASEVLRLSGARVGTPAWLGEAAACDVPFEGVGRTTVSEAVRAALAGTRIDAAVLPAAGRRKKLLVADMESTIIENEMLDELADFLGLREHIAAITARAMNGEIDFAAALRERVGLLRDLPEARLGEAAARIRYMSGAQALIATMRAHGAYCALVSGGFTTYTALVRAKLGFDEDRANRLLVANGRLLGTVGEPILGREAKLAALEELAGDRGVPLALTLAVGDGANDLPMLQAAGLGVAYHAKPSVAAATAVRIDHGDLRALLYLQGYRDSEIA